MTLSVSATTQLLADERSSHRRNAPMFAFVPTFRHLVIRAVNVLQDLRNAIFDTYRPELYYMRGPGPKWHAKHGGRVQWRKGDNSATGKRKLPSAREFEATAESGQR
jgi:hypothetical protein